MEKSGRVGSKWSCRVGSKWRSGRVGSKWRGMGGVSPWPQECLDHGQWW